jgi:hypothetical protein
MNHEVFISYSSKDKAVADAVCHVLEQHGMQCWIAPRDVQPGARYAAEIVNGIKNCKVMVLVYSKESNQSDHVANEVDRAFNGGKTIIPFLVDDTPMNDEFDYYLSRKHWLVAYPHYADQLENLAHAVANVLGIEFKSLSEIVQSNHKSDGTTSHQDNPVHSAEAEIHIEVDTDCNLYSFKTFLMKLERAKDNVIKLKPGKYKFEFVSTLYAEAKMSLVYSLSPEITCDFMDVKLKDAESEVQLKNLELYPISRNGKYGYIDKTGKVVIPCKWEYADSFSEGLASVQNDNGKRGFIDKTGTVVIPCKWEDAEYFSEGLARVKDDNGKWGFIDKTGKVVIPCKWKDVNFFSEGLARVKDDNGTEFYIDKAENLVSPKS